MDSAHPERAPQLSVGQLRGQLQVLEADSLPRPLVPGEEHGQLEGGHLQVVLAHLVLEGDLENPKKPSEGGADGDQDKVSSRVGRSRLSRRGDSRCRWTSGGASAASCRCGSSCRSPPPLG